MERYIKQDILEELGNKFGKSIDISLEQWETAKIEAFNDIYANSFCFQKDASYDYFKYVMVGILSIILTQAA